MLLWRFGVKRLDYAARLHLAAKVTLFSQKRVHFDAFPRRLDDAVKLIYLF